MRELRLAALADSPSAFASTYAAERGLTAAQWLAWVESCAWFVAEVDGAPAGIAAGRPSPERPGLISMWVHPAHRGRRLADTLIGAVLAWAAGEGARELTLWVADGNEAATRAYARAGFAPTGRRQPLPSDPAVGEEEWAHPLDRPGDDDRMLA